MTTGTDPVTESRTGIDKAYEWAHERAEAVQALYIHLLVFGVLNVALFGINWATRGDTGVWWFYWPLMVWGAGLVIHVLVTLAPVFSPDWAERRAERMLQRGSN